MLGNSSKQLKSPQAPSCAGFIVFCVSDNEHYVLLVSTNRNVWGFPKGKRNSGEQYEECAFRELNEETGLKRDQIVPIDLGSFCLHEITEKGTPSVKLYLAKTDTLIEPDVQDVDEIGCARWVKIEDALSMLTLKNRKQILQDAVEYFINSTKLN